MRIRRRAASCKGKFSLPWRPRRTCCKACCDGPSFLYRNCPERDLRDLPGDAIPDRIAAGGRPTAAAGDMRKLLFAERALRIRGHAVAGEAPEPLRDLAHVRSLFW